MLIPEVEPFPELPVVVPNDDWADVVGFAYGVGVTIVPDPRVTTPPRVMLPGVAGTCAETGRAAASQIRIAQPTGRFIGIGGKQSGVVPVKCGSMARFSRRARLGR